MNVSFNSALLPATMGADRLATLAASAETPSAETAKAMGQKFEGLLLSQLLKQLRNSIEGGLFPGESSDTYGAMFDQYMSEFLAQNGGLGLAAHLEKSMQRAVAAPPPTEEQLLAARPLNLRSSE